MKKIIKARKSVQKGRLNKFKRKLERASYKFNYRNPSPNEMNFLSRAGALGEVYMERLKKESELKAKRLRIRMKRLLSQVEVDSLSDGEKVIIIWPHANAPYEYEIIKRGGVSYIATVAKRTKNRYCGARISPVGFTEGYVRVALADGG